MPKVVKQRQGEKLRNRNLGEQINADNETVKEKKKNPKNKKEPKDEKDEENEFISAKQSKRILDQARAQRKEIDSERSNNQKNNKIKIKTKQNQKNTRSGEFLFESDESDDYSDEEKEDVEETVNEDTLEEDLVNFEENGQWVASSNITEAEERIIQSFLSPTTERRTLADLIMEKLQERENNNAQMDKGNDGDDQDIKPRVSIPSKVSEVYSKIGKILTRYTAGRLPKAFKIIPSLTNWEDITFLTRPDEWTPQATFAATKLFASNLNEKMAQRFYNLILLDKVREDIRANKKLNYHLYQALKKAMYKPEAFIKGILLPLAQCGSCTLREAAIVGSILTRVSIPIHHNAAALVKLSQMSYNGSTSMFIRVLINKKHNLFISVIDALVSHFLRFCDEKRQLPVLWHQSLLVFAQRYKQEITKEQKNQMKALLRLHYHHQITPEIRRELFNSVSRGEVAPEQQMAIPAAHPDTKSFDDKDMDL